MALKIKNNGKYIKLDAAGNFDIYASEEARARVKNSTTSETIIAKYQKIITKLENNAERKYYDRKAFAAEYNAWVAEFQRYMHDLKEYNYGKRYPLMMKYYPDVSDSIPEIIEAGCIFLENESVEDAYNSAKNGKYWDETDDV